MRKKISGRAKQNHNKIHLGKNKRSTIAKKMIKRSQDNWRTVLTGFRADHKAAVILNLGYW